MLGFQWLKERWGGLAISMARPRWGNGGTGGCTTVTRKSGGHEWRHEDRPQTAESVSTREMRLRSLIGLQPSGAEEISTSEYRPSSPKHIRGELSNQSHFQR